jgi:DNA-3-methyladenine glycosylase I
MADPTPPRCAWAQTNPLLASYHDTEWGVPLFDDQRLFEMLNLEGAQAGLSWLTILGRRAGYRQAFDNFDARKIASYSPAKQAALLQDTSIIRNRLKINAVIENAHAYLKLQADQSFTSYIWGFTHGKPLVGNHDLAVQTSLALSKDLKKRGFRFVGPTTCYAFMQAVGLINDHEPDCARYSAVMLY